MQSVEEFESKMTEETFWDDHEKAQEILQKTKFLKDKLNDFGNLENQLEELETLIEMAIEECDESVELEVDSICENLKMLVNKQKIESLLCGEYDANNAILSIHAGTGGLDAQDWAEMLMRMYIRWSEKKGYKVKIIDLIRDTESGIKSALITIEGLNAYGFLKSEKGVHRLVRISPFDSSGKRHTSFASIDIMPELDEDCEIEINPNDIKIDTFRASGAGGQHINKTDSAVRITHIPTGIVVQCQNERSQHYNKSTAMRLLMSKLVELKENEQIEKIDDLKGDYSQIAWGSQIRSYVFHPYNMVKDHRTNSEVGNVQGVMDGDIDGFIDAYLVSKLKSK